MSKNVAVGLSEGTGPSVLRDPSVSCDPSVIVFPHSLFDFLHCSYPTARELQFFAELYSSTGLGIERRYRRSDRLGK